MKQVSIVPPGEGELVLSNPWVEMRILEDGSTTEHRLGMAEIVLGPHAPGPPQHRHAQHDEGFYVVAGSVRFTVGEDVHDAGPGTLVMIPTGAPHTFENAGEHPATVINTFTPDLYVQYFRDLRDMIAAGRPQTVETVVPVMARYATEPATDYAES
jgi:mannose-6-phosphate isomerase-like protein (cupin superfamily)